ncbi:MAG TPA: hypothetical protein VEL11_01605 [Candidatus Bathyarchaeia archaeon]|nr:hypothetical protein [Candidatus Bathyarchaeia archaeon]
MTIALGDSSISDCGHRAGGTDICAIKSQSFGVTDEEIVYVNKYLNYVRSKSKRNGIVETKNLTFATMQNDFQKRQQGS